MKMEHLISHTLHDGKVVATIVFSSFEDMNTILRKYDFLATDDSPIKNEDDE